MALREILASFGFQIDTKALEKVDSKITSVKEKMGTFAKGAVQTFLGLGAIHIAKGAFDETQELADRLLDTGNALGMQATQLQSWEYRLKKAGVEAGAMSGSVRKLLLATAAANEGNQEAKQSFKDLDVSLRDANGNTKDASTLLEEVGLKLATIEDPAKRAALGTKLLGKGGMDLLPVFAGGKEGLQAFDDELARFGGGLSQEAIDSLAEVGDATDTYEVAVTSLKGKLATVLAPVMLKATNLLAKFTAQISKSDKSSIGFRSTVQAVGVALAAAGVAAIAPWLPMLLVLTGLFLLVQDLFVFLKGGDSLIGRFIERAYGKKAKDGALQDIHDWMKKIQQESSKGRTAGERFKLGFLAAISPITKELEQFWNNDLPQFGQTLGEQASDLGREFLDSLLAAANPVNGFVGWIADIAGIDITPAVEAFKKAGAAIRDALLSALVKFTLPGQALQNLASDIENKVKGALNLPMSDTSATNSSPAGRAMLQTLSALQSQAGPGPAAPQQNTTNNTTNTIQNRPTYNITTTDAKVVDQVKTLNGLDTSAIVSSLEGQKA